jgi:hypothetical protein
VIRCFCVGIVGGKGVDVFPINQIGDTFFVTVEIDFE